MRLIKALLAGCSSYGYQVITAKEAKIMIEAGELIIIDVREKEEYDQGHIQDAILIPLSSINKDNELLPDKDKTVLVYCRSGNRSAKAAKKLVDLGYEDIYDFGGILDWPYATTK